VDRAVQVGTASNAGAAPVDGASEANGRWPSFLLPADGPPFWPAETLLKNVEGGWAAEGATRGPTPSQVSRLRRPPR